MLTTMINDNLTSDIVCRPNGIMSRETGECLTNMGLPPCLVLRNMPAIGY